MIDQMPLESGNDVTFESALEQIRATVTALESGNLTLEESLAKFQEGSKLIDQCRGIISNAELRIRELTDAAETDN
jgi:exodeoxyribonuclease VII small subunit